MEQSSGDKDMFPDGSDVILVIRTAKTTATWYKTSNGYFITADPIGQNSAVRIVESDEEVARSAKAPRAVLQALPGVANREAALRPLTIGRRKFQLGNLH